MIRLVLDSDVVVAAMRSPAGASAQVLRLLRNGELTALATVAVALEYEAVCLRAEHLEAAGLNDLEGRVFIEAVIAMTEPIETHFLWRPILKDPNDEMILEAAANGRADMIVSFNRRDFQAAERFGIDVCLPRDALIRIIQKESR